MYEPVHALHAHPQSCICTRTHELKHAHRDMCLHVYLYTHVLEVCTEPTEALLRGNRTTKLVNRGCPVHLHLSHIFWKV